MQDDPRRVRKAQSGDSIESGSFRSFLSKPQLIGRTCLFVSVSWRGVYFPVFSASPPFLDRPGFPFENPSRRVGPTPGAPSSPLGMIFWVVQDRPSTAAHQTTTHAEAHLPRACCGPRDQPDTPEGSCRSVHACDARGTNHGDEEKGRRGRTRVPTSSPPSVKSSPGRNTAGERKRERRGVRDASKRIVAACKKNASKTPRNAPRLVACPTKQRTTPIRAT